VLLYLAAVKGSSAIEAAQPGEGKPKRDPRARAARDRFVMGLVFVNASLLAAANVLGDYRIWMPLVVPGAVGYVRGLWKVRAAA
jgi:hypothetical protein